MPFGLYLLTWDQLERGRGPLELDGVRAKLAALLAEPVDKTTPPYLVEERISSVLVEHYGAWALGWCWWADDGGLIHGRAAILDVDAVLASLQQWHAVLDELGHEFEQLGAPEHTPLAELVEYAAAVLVEWVLARTHAYDAWYQSFVRVLGWCLQAWAFDDATAEAELARVVSGRFESWIVPTPAQIDATSAELGACVAARYDSQPRDATLAWIDTRRRAFGSTFSVALVDGQHPAHDGHARFIDGVERRRDPIRADRMREALRQCRASAFAGEPLDLAMLAHWNAIVLGQPSSPLRQTDAYAKSGRERYGTAAT